MIISVNFTQKATTALTGYTSARRPKKSTLIKTAVKITDTLYKAKYDGVEYLITVKNYIPTRIDYEDKLGNKIKITLSNTKKDFKISDDLLTPVIPSYYDIINQ